MSNSPSLRIYNAILFASVLCLTLAGCQAFKRSDTWAKVTRVRGTNNLDPNASEQYASRLHEVLKSNAVEHKVVTYQYRYTTRLREEAVGTRTAVLYKDKATPGSPWWLMDNQLGKPVWLPNAQVERQVEFYLHQPTQVVAQADFSGAGSAKAMLADSPASQIPANASQMAKAKPQNFRHKQPQISEPVSQESASFIAAAAETKPTWFERAAALFRVPRVETQSTSAPQTMDIDQIFRASHGTDYNPSSLKDRRKMEQLKQALLGSSQADGSQTL